MDVVFDRRILFCTLLLLSEFCLAEVPANSGMAAKQTTPASTLLTLWYGSPAKTWTDALAIGNGRLGAMLFGIPEHDRYQLNDITVWSGGPMPNADRPGAYQALPAIREALRSGDYAAATKLVSEHMTTTGVGDSEYWPSYETLGDLNFDHVLPAGDVTNYRRWLDIERALSGVDFSVGGVRFHRESFSTAPDHAIVSRFWSDASGKISFTVQLSRIANASTTAQSNDTLLMAGDTTFPPQPAQPARPPVTSGPRKGFQGRPAKPATDARPGNLEYEVQLRVHTFGGVVRAEGDHLVVQDADEATVILTAGTSYVLDWSRSFRRTSPHQQVTEQMKSVSSKSYDEMKTAHVTDYRHFFDRVRFLPFHS